MTCRRCNVRPATQGPRGRYANLCDGCKHKAIAEWRAQLSIAKAPRRRAAEHTFPVVPVELCENQCGRPPITDSSVCRPCLELLQLAAELPPPPTAEQMQKATEAFQAARARAEDAIGAYRRAKSSLEQLRRSIRVQHQLERQRLKRPKPGPVRQVAA